MNNVLLLPDGSVRVASEWGGYPLFHITTDATVLCATCVERNIEKCSDSSHIDSGWYVLGHCFNWNDPRLYCDHCSKRIESAYAEDEHDNWIKQQLDCTA